MVTAAKLSVKIEYPNKILPFIENLCCRSLKIAVCAPKITIISKNCRLKILVRVRVYARMYARAYDCQDSTSDTRRTHTTIKGRNTGKHKTKFTIVGRSTRQQRKKSIKKVKKNLELRKKVVPLQYQNDKTKKEKHMKKSNTEKLERVFEISILVLGTLPAIIVAVTEIVTEIVTMIF